MSQQDGITEVPSIPPEEYGRYGIDREKLLELLKSIVTIRLFEETVEALFLERGLLYGPAHLCLGQEAVAAGVIKAVEDNDVILSNHRGHGHALAKGVPVSLVMGELFGKSTGVCRGISGSMHVATHKETNCVYASAIVGSNIPIATGVGFALKKEGRGRMAVCFFGDGASNTGAFHEGINMSSVLRVPVLFVCENNRYAISMKDEESVAARSIAERAAYSYNIPTFLTDGNDVLAVYRATVMASKRIRSEQAPAFLECLTYRLKGHGVYDKSKYRPVGEAEKWKERDPVIAFTERLLREGIITQSRLQSVRKEIEDELENAVEVALESPVLPFEQLGSYVYSGGREQ